MIFWLLGVIVGIPLALGVLLYVIQEKLIFFPSSLPADYRFQFEQPFEEVFIETEDHTMLHGILFKADSSKGLVFYLHGNAGALDSWGTIAETYTSLQYDLFIPDYRGFGKSVGGIKSEAQFFADVQAAYDVMKKRYSEDRIVVIGYSIGSGSAAMLAATNHPKQLILQAPYYSLIDMMNHYYPFLPGFILKYKFETFRFLQQTKSPVTLFHGNEDRVIYYESSLKLKKHLKPGDRVIILEGEGHHGMNENDAYRKELNRLLK